MCLKMLTGEKMTCGHRIFQILMRMTHLSNLQGMPTPAMDRRSFLSNDTPPFWAEIWLQTIASGAVSREEVLSSYP